MIIERFTPFKKNSQLEEKICVNSVTSNNNTATETARKPTAGQPDGNREKQRTANEVTAGQQQTAKQQQDSKTAARQKADARQHESSERAQKSRKVLHQCKDTDGIFKVIAEGYRGNLNLLRGFRPFL